MRHWCHTMMHNDATRPCNVHNQKLASKLFWLTTTLMESHGLQKLSGCLYRMFVLSVFKCVRSHIYIFTGTGCFQRSHSLPALKPTAEHLYGVSTTAQNRLTLLISVQRQSANLFILVSETNGDFRNCKKGPTQKRYCRKSLIKYKFDLF